MYREQQTILFVSKLLANMTCQFCPRKWESQSAVIPQSLGWSRWELCPGAPEMRKEEEYEAWLLGGCGILQATPLTFQARVFIYTPEGHTVSQHPPCSTRTKTEWGNIAGCSVCNRNAIWTLFPDALGGWSFGEFFLECYTPHNN